MVLVVVFIVLISVLVGMVVTGTMTLSSVTGRGQKDRSLTALLDGAVEDYLFRMNQGVPGSYLKYAQAVDPGCVTGVNSAATDSANPYMNGFAELPGQAGQGTDPGKVNYSVDLTQWCKKGIVVLNARAEIGDGKSPGSTKAMNYYIRKQGFLDYVYFTDYETLNPARYDPKVFDINAIRDMCERHYFDPSKSGAPAPRPEIAEGKSPGCTSISWMSNDSLEGDMHTNDAIIVCGWPWFNGKTTTGWAGDGIKHYINNINSSCDNGPDFWANKTNGYCGKINDACQASIFTMPASTITVKSVPGSCVYSGPTSIRFVTTQKYWVRSPYTTPTALCGGGNTDQLVSYPSSGLIYVQNVPAAQQATLTPCTIPSGGSTPQNALGYPKVSSSGSGQDVTAYGCFDGDAFVEGVFDGGVSVASENRTIITKDLKKNNAESLLGLMANQGIEVYHPYSPSGTIPGYSPINYVQAALLTLDDSVSTQNYDQGSHLGFLEVYGSIAQKWRGAMGTTDGQHGYYKNFTYDPALRTTSPPVFLTPTNGNYLVFRKDPV